METRILSFIRDGNKLLMIKRTLQCYLPRVMQFLRALRRSGRRENSNFQLSFPKTRALICEAYKPAEPSAKSFQASLHINGAQYMIALLCTHTKLATEAQAVMNKLLTKVGRQTGAQLCVLSLIGGRGQLCML